MIKFKYQCGLAVAGALALAASALHAQNSAAPATQKPAPVQLPGPAAPGAPQVVPPPMPELLKQYKPVSSDRLKNPTDGDWAMIRRTYDGWGYSPLDQIKPDNVRRLQPAWVFSTGFANGHEAPPLVVNGVMFVSTPGNQVIAIDAKTGTLLWRYRRPLPTPVVLLHPTSRGVAVYNDKVYFAAGEAVLVALDARTGEEVWTAQVADNASGYYMSLAPLVADGKVLVGTSGGELGIRGFVAAFDADTGAELWKTYMVPAPGRAGQRNLAERRGVEDRRRLGLGDGELRPRDESLFLGNRQRRSVDGRPAARGQSLHRVHGGARRGDRGHQGPHAIQPQRVVGLG